MSRTGSNYEMNRNKKTSQPISQHEVSTNNTIYSNMSHHTDVVDRRIIKTTHSCGLAPECVAILSDCYRVLGLGFSFAKEIMYSWKQFSQCVFSFASSAADENGTFGTSMNIKNKSTPLIWIIHDCLWLVQIVKEFLPRKFVLFYLSLTTFLVFFTSFPTFWNNVGSLFHR